MKFSTKIFCAIFFTASIICFISEGIIYCFLKNNIEQEYILKYQNYSNIIANTFNQIELSANQINENAARVLYEIEKNSGLPSNANLTQLANTLGIKAFYVANKNGKFIRSTDLPLEKQTNSLYDYCKDYRLLIHGNSILYRTPIIPGFPYNIPMKLTMIPNYNRTLILESGLELNYIGNILHQLIKNDSNVKSIGFYTPTGIELGFITGLGAYHRGRQNFVNLGQMDEQSVILRNDSFIFNKKITTIDALCCECNNRKISSNKGDYFYILRLEVSNTSLKKSLSFLRERLLMAVFVSCFFTIIVSKLLARKLVSRIEKINQTASDIIASNNLNLRVDIAVQHDEISKLAYTFNKMIKTLKLSQEKIVDAEKKSALFEIAAKVSHDIRSPLSAMDLVLQKLSKCMPKDDLKILASGIQNIWEIANNMLIRYRNQDKALDLLSSLNEQNISCVRPVFLPSLCEKIISQKLFEWSHNPCKIELIIECNIFDCWIIVLPNELKRVLSNLINNAYDAIENKLIGLVQIIINLSNTTLHIQLRDNGVGIRPEKLSDVLNGISSKHPGKGLGISSAKSYMEKISDQFYIKSSIGNGTEINLVFPRAKCPSWFSKEIVLQDKAIVIVIDRDLSMLMYWKQRINEAGLAVKLYGNYKDAAEWVSNFENQVTSAIFLVEYELEEQETNGLLFLKSLNITNNGYLFTNYAEELSIQHEVKKAGIWMIPKSIVSSISFVY